MSRKNVLLSIPSLLLLVIFALCGGSTSLPLDGGKEVVAQLPPIGDSAAVSGQLGGRGRVGLVRANAKSESASF